MSAPAHIVTVRPGNQGERYIDSIWIELSRAEGRVNALKEEFKRNGFDVVTSTVSRWHVWVTSLPIEDARIETPREGAS